MIEAERMGEEEEKRAASGSSSSSSGLKKKLLKNNWTRPSESVSPASVAPSRASPQVHPMPSGLDNPSSNHQH